MNLLARIAERKIRNAMEQGWQPPAGWRNRPLLDETQPFMPDDLKMAYKILKNAGYLPPEIQVRREIQQVEELLAAATDEKTRLRQMKKLDILLRKLEQVRGRPANLATQDAYYRKVVEKVGVRRDK